MSLRNSFIGILTVYGMRMWGQEAFIPVEDTFKLKSRIILMAKSTSTLQSDFVQIKDLSLLREKITSYGHFWYKNENHLRWEYQKPYSYLILMEGNKLQIRSENKTKTFHLGGNKFFQELNTLITSCINGEIVGSGKFKIHYFKNQAFFKLELVPYSKEMGETLSKAELYFNAELSSVVKIELWEASGDLTLIEFKGTIRNAEISDTHFTLH